MIIQRGLFFEGEILRSYFGEDVLVCFVFIYNVRGNHNNYLASNLGLPISTKNHKINSMDSEDRDRKQFRQINIKQTTARR